MKTCRGGWLCIFLPALISCSSIGPLRPPVEGGISANISVAERFPAAEEKWSVTSVPNSYFGISGARGNLFAGLLLGPIGVAANASYVQGKNTKALSSVADLTATNLAVLMKSAITLPLAKTPPNKPGYVLIPAAALTFDTDTSYYLTCILTAEYPTAVNGVWRGSYRVTRDTNFAVSDPLAKDKSIADLTECFRESYRLFVTHVSGEDGTYTVRTAKFKNSMTSLRMPIQDKALPDRIIGNDNAGLTEFRKIDVESVE
jgi:hypothetical protein